MLQYNPPHPFPILPPNTSSHPPTQHLLPSSHPTPPPYSLSTLHRRLFLHGQVDHRGDHKRFNTGTPNDRQRKPANHRVSGWIQVRSCYEILVFRIFLNFLKLFLK